MQQRQESWRATEATTQIQEIQMSDVKGKPKVQQVRAPGSDMILGYSDATGFTSTPPGTAQSGKWRIVPASYSQPRARGWAAPGST